MDVKIIKGLNLSDFDEIFQDYMNILKVYNKKYSENRFNNLSKEEYITLILIINLINNSDLIKQFDFEFAIKYKEKYEKYEKIKFSDPTQIYLLKNINDTLKNHQKNINFKVKELLKEKICNYIDLQNDKDIKELFVKLKMLGINCDEYLIFIDNSANL